MNSLASWLKFMFNHCFEKCRFQSEILKICMPGKLNFTLDEVLYDVTASNIEFSATVAVLRLNERLHENMAFNLINCRLKARSHGIVKKFGAGSPRCHLWSPESTTPPLAVCTVPKFDTARKEKNYHTRLEYLHLAFIFPKV